MNFNKFKRIKLLGKSIYILRSQYGLMQLATKVIKVIWKTIIRADFKHAKRIFAGLIDRHLDALTYTDWIVINEDMSASKADKQRKHLESFSYRPRFSIIVPTYNTPNQIMVEFIDSVISQTYPHWELCIADDASSLRDVRATLDRYVEKDARIKVIYRDSNGHIAEATNSALAMATGEFVCLMDHDDTIAPNALYEFAVKLNENSELDFIYSDEDKISFDGTLRFDPHFKPDWSPEYLECCMYTAHFACYRTEIVNKIGGFRQEYNGAQDYDFMLRFSEHVNKVAHVPKMLYHWRAIPGSTATSMDNKDYVVDAAIRALKDYIARTGKLGLVKSSFYKGCFQTRYHVKGSPKVSIVIPSAGRNNIVRGKETDLLANCIATVMKKSTYKNIEIIVVDNNDLRQETLAALAIYPVKFTHYTNPVFNIATKMNLGAQQATGEFLLFLNDDIEVISEDWIEAMLSVAQRPGVGVVGARLYFENDTLQHVGVTFCNGLPDHIRRGFPGDDPGYFFSSEGQRNYLAVTGACMLLRRDLFQEVSGFEEAFAINYNDIDLCLKIWQLGCRNVYTGQAKLYHFESLNRKREVAVLEQELFLKRWGEKVAVDPYYSQYFSTSPPNFELRYAES